MKLVSIFQESVHDESVSNRTTTLLVLLIRGGVCRSIGSMYRDSVQPLAHDTGRLSRRLLREHKLRLHTVWSQHIPIFQWWSQLVLPVCGIRAAACLRVCSSHGTISYVQSMYQ